VWTCYGLGEKGSFGSEAWWFAGILGTSLFRFGVSLYQMQTPRLTNYAFGQGLGQHLCSFRPGKHLFSHCRVC